MLERKYATKNTRTWGRGNWFLHHDNAPAHESQKTTEFVTNNNNLVIVPHPPYSPDLAPCVFAVSQIENETEGTTF
jgi:transposase